MRAISLFAFCFSIALILATAPLGAAPLSGSAKGLTQGAALMDAIQTVHGCHHVCARGRAGWHRHGPRCGRIPC
jgi:hypothetical protein